jgi:DNA-directed RNA polymerase I subunit RPA1
VSTFTNALSLMLTQNYLAMAEAATIANTDNQYIVPTSGNPLRGLIQDHVVSGVKLTCRDTFLSKQEFQQLVYIAVTGLPGTEVISYHEEIILPCPAILKPIQRWTGKQVISTLIKHLCRPPLPSLHLDGKTRTPPTAFGEDQREHIVIFRFSELLCGVMDKAAIGSSSLGIVHAVYELYGPELAGRLLNAFGRLFTFYLQDAGQSCGIEDLTLNTMADDERKKLLVKVAKDAEIGLKKFLTEKDSSSTSATSSSSSHLTDEERAQCRDLMASFMLSNGMEEQKRANKAKLDSSMQEVINKSASTVIKACIPNGLELSFQVNDFAMMVLTGAKGSVVNLSQICCFLGQQALEGMRVPVMISGKTLPSFMAYDSSARAGGFVQDRFLTGVKPQEYYFHCMAGREGLVDTAVKTSRSGYLQRCLVKHLEELKLQYDMTVRDSGGNVVQFMYGEDGLDPVHTALLGGSEEQMQFLARNNQALVYKYALHNDFFAHAKVGGLEMETAMEYHEQMKKAKALVDKVSARSRRPADVREALIESLEKGSVVLARRKINEVVDWERANLQRIWCPAEIVKVRSPAHEKKSRSKNLSDNDKFLDDLLHQSVTYDIKYLSDGIVAKRVPLVVFTKPRIHDSKVTIQSLPLPLIRAALPDTAMSKLKLNTAVGAVSEHIQKSISTFVKANPENVITEHTTDTTVSAQAFELLVWMKYLKGLACPGEAVGCVAAQSVGEPSTQMTLNTFHLAGHGGANVTLGIPRLREILMTAAKVPKTPTMLIPIRTTPGLSEESYLAKAQVLARTLSKLSLNTLLDHKGGVEVRENLARGPSGLWERHYHIKLLFESPQLIKQVFKADFSEVVACVKTAFLARLKYLMRIEQRRAGGKGRFQDPIQHFKAKSETPRSRGNLSGEADEDGRDAEKSEKNGSWKDVGDDEDEDEDEPDDMDDAEQGTLRLGRKKEMIGYADDENEEDIELDDIEVDNRKTKGTSEKDSSVSSDDEDETRPKSDKIFSDDESASEDDLADADSSDSDIDDSVTKIIKKPIVKMPKKASTGKNTSVKGDSFSKSDDGLVIDAKRGSIELSIAFEAGARRILMVQLAERAARDSTVRMTKNINNAYPVPCTVNGISGAGVQTEGVNMEAVFALPESLIEFEEMKCNDIWGILNIFGVEAARKSIVSEILTVFGSYGINVNPRHLSLIADFMTRTGSYVPMNRNGMWSCPSPFLQMSFETTCTFLNKAAQEGLSDAQESPSARLVLGSVAKVGTGCFDLIVPLEKQVVA